MRVILATILVLFVCATSSALTSEEISKQVERKIENETGIKPLCWITGEQATELYKQANSKIKWVSLPIGENGNVPIYPADKLSDIIGVTSIDQADAPNKNHPALGDGGAMISVEYDDSPLSIEFYAILMEKQKLGVIQFNPWNLKKKQLRVTEPAPKSCPLVA
jgi:hypothetical protein